VHGQQQGVDGDLRRERTQRATSLAIHTTRSPPTSGSSCGTACRCWPASPPT